MAPTTIAWLVILAALIVVLAFVVAQVLRSAREAARIKRRVDAYADLPVLVALRDAEATVPRLEASLQAIPPLVARAQAAAATIKRGPIPPDVVNGVVAIGVEIQNLRRLLQ